MDYQDFTIDLQSTAAGDFEATVAIAPIDDNPRVPFSRPIAPEDLSVLLCAGEVAEGQEPPPPPSPRKHGRQLFSEVFRNGLGDLFLRCREAICHDQGQGLRLRLRFRTSDAEAAYLAALPWEWMWDPESEDYLATNLATPVVRALSTGRLRKPLAVTSPLRILVVDAAPKTMKQLDLKLEIERMTEALGPLIEAKQVELHQLAKPTLDHLRDALRDKEIHVLHFMGHGGYDAKSGLGAIFLEGQDGSKLQVDGEELSAYLKAIPSLRLVVLNACKSARHAGRKGAPFYFGVASALIERTGVPAVVANQYSISDAAAIRFSEAFYGRIAKGDGVDEAVTEARLRLHGSTPEWATPVLFLSASSGKLFTVDEAHRQRSVGGVRRSRPEEELQRLGIRSFVGWGRDMDTRTDAVLDLTEHFAENRFIKDQAWWQERIFPALRAFLREHVDEKRPLLLDFAAHASIAFAAGWLLEPKSGLDVRVRQRIEGKGELEWHPRDGSEPEGALWLKRRPLRLDPSAPDVAVALAVSQKDVPKQVQHFIQRAGLPVGRIVDATIAPEPGGQAVRGGAHALRLAQTLLPRLQPRFPQEREGRLHFFCAAPNALVFYLGQLATFLGNLVLYEYPFRAENAYGRYQRSIELPPPGEILRVPEDW